MPRLRGLLSSDSRFLWTCEGFAKDDKHLAVFRMSKDHSETDVEIALTVLLIASS